MAVVIRGRAELTAHRAVRIVHDGRLQEGDALVDGGLPLADLLHEEHLEELVARALVQSLNNRKGLLDEAELLLEPVNCVRQRALHGRRENLRIYWRLLNRCRSRRRRTVSGTQVGRVGGAGLAAAAGLGLGGALVAGHLALLY